MIKRFSVVFDSGLRQKIEDCPGLREAMRFIGAAVLYGFAQTGNSDYHGPQRKLKKIFDSSYCEGGAFMHAFRDAARLSVFVNLYDDHHLEVKMEFFAKNEKTPFYGFRVCFTLNGAISSSGAHSR